VRITIHNNFISAHYFDKDIIVKPTDKKLGIAIIPRDWYEKQVLNALNDEENYKAIDILPTYEDIFNKLKDKLKKEKIKLDEKVENFIFETYNKQDGKTIHNPIPTSKFYGLPKVHKAPISL
jgi:hypothetical protein